MSETIVVLVQNGFPLESILGKEVIEEGLTEDQMVLFAHAIEAVSVRKIHDNTLAYASVTSDKEGAKAVQKAMAEKDNIMFKFLLNHGED